MDDLISRKAAIAFANDQIKKETGAYSKGRNTGIRVMKSALNNPDAIPSVPAVPLDKLCGLLAEMYHCPASGWPASNHACHPGCPDEAFEKLCGTGCEKHTDVERWHAFLTKWMEEQDAKEEI